MNVREAFRRQAVSCTGLGSPFMGRLMTLAADRLAPGHPVADKILNWPGRPEANKDSVPLRFAGALHALQIEGDPDLTAAYPPNDVSDDTLWHAAQIAIDRHTDAILRFLDSPPQTNEVRRSAALIAATTWLKPDHPLILSELGASAGLNLMFDRFALATPNGPLGASDPALTLTPDWQGEVPAPHPVSVAERRGCDLSPIDPSDPDHRTRLRAYLWPDQPERRALTDAAIAAHDAPVDRAKAQDWIASRLTHRPGHHHLIYHTIAWQYFPDDAQGKATALIEEAGASATSDTPLSWLSVENDEGRGAGITIRCWPGNRAYTLGRFDFHGRWIDWQPAALPEAPRNGGRAVR
ncbi:DUF2332 domain-containing protein [Aestuariibius insulae]|uniref:DUF2332 domain-containing protein n=1 Tax=Aestuariibius insulae TaxID=2058287 RepID=UPI00345E98AA